MKKNNTKLKLKKLLKNPQIIILLAILLLVSIPYIEKIEDAINKVAEERRNAAIAKSEKEKQEEVSLVVKKAEDLMNRYEIEHLEVSSSNGEVELVVPSRLYSVDTARILESNMNEEACDVYAERFDGSLDLNEYLPSSYKSRQDVCLDLIEAISDFEAEAGKRQQLIDANKNSSDKEIKKIVSGLIQGLEDYNEMMNK